MFLQAKNVQVLCLTEHWLKSFEVIDSFKTFNFGSVFNRKTAIRGGSLILVSNKLKFKERTDIVNLSIECVVELSCIELGQHIVICVYRPPSSDFSEFETVIENVLSKVFHSKKKIIICGDFNIDLLVDSTNRTRLLSLFKSFNLRNLFLEPTRITISTATCIDNVFCNCEFIDKDILNCLPSDHCGQIVTFPSVADAPLVRSQCRPVTKSKSQKFRSAILASLANSNLTSDQPNDKFDLLFKKISTAFQHHFPLKTITKGTKLAFSDWATDSIHRCRRKLYGLYEEKTHTFDEEFKQYVRAYSRIFRSVCKTAKSLFLKRRIVNSDDKIKTVWKIINEETGRNKPHNQPFALKVNDKLVNSKTEIAQIFEDFFTEIPIKTTKNLNSSPEAAESLMKDNVKICEDKFKFRTISANVIISTFKTLNMKQTEDLWGLSVKTISSIIDVVAPFLADIFNLCIESGTFPDLMKLSKVIPLFKAGDRENSNDYRPISILPVFSKIFEKVMLNQMLSHFNINKLLHNKQFGFTKGRSTTDAGVALIKNIFQAWENREDSIGVFCDLSKAFDCVDHKTLLLKLKHYGCNDLAIAMIESYLINRTQKISINNELSQGSTMKMGVPQGSILGPFLFLVYINDLPFLIEKQTDIVLFADDTSLIFKIKRNDSYLGDANNTLTNLQNWFTKNNLLLNAKKTKCIKFSLPNVKQTDDKLTLGNEKLDFVDSTVFLGIKLDSKLQWGPHIETLAGRLSSAAYAVKKIRQMTDENTARLVYFSYFHSIMAYGILLWGRAADVETIFVLQKRAIRAIYNLSNRHSLRHKFREINILTVAGQYIFDNIMYVKKNLYSLKKGCDVHDINLRRKNKLVTPHFRLSKVNNSFVGNSIRFFNKLPEDSLQLSDNKFKKYVKQHLLKKGYYKVEDYVNDKDAWCC